MANPGPLSPLSAGPHPRPLTPAPAPSLLAPTSGSPACTQPRSPEPRPHPLARPPPLNPSHWVPASSGPGLHPCKSPLGPCTQNPGRCRGPSHSMRPGAGAAPPAAARPAEPYFGSWRCGPGSPARKEGYSGLGRPGSATPGLPGRVRAQDRGHARAGFPYLPSTPPSSQATPSSLLFLARPWSFLGQRAMSSV
jgi:hypothetical protein